MAIVLEELHRLVRNAFAEPGGFVADGPLPGRCWGVIRGFPDGIRGWPTAPSLGGSIMEKKIQA